MKLEKDKEWDEIKVKFKEWCEIPCNRRLDGKFSGSDDIDFERFNSFCILEKEFFNVDYDRKGHLFWIIEGRIEVVLDGSGKRGLSFASEWEIGRLMMWKQEYEKKFRGCDVIWKLIFIEQLSKKERGRIIKSLKRFFDRNSTGILYRVKG